MAGFVALNMVVAYRFRPMFRMPSPEQSGLERYRAAVTPIRIWLLVGVSVLLGLFAGTSASGQWRQFMLWRNGGDSGAPTPTSTATSGSTSSTSTGCTTSPTR